MGGSPNDDPRDMARGGNGRSFDDESSDPKAVPGAFGSLAGAQADAESVTDQAVGPPLASSNTLDDVKAALKKSKETDPA